MATSGSNSVAITSYDTMTISWTLNSQSTTNNTSSITFTAKLVASNYGKISSSASKSYTATINGTSYSGTNTVGISNNSTITLFSKTLTISHDSDGSKSFTFKFQQEFSITFSGSWKGTYSVSCTVNPTTIARASTITSASNVTLGNACSVKWTPASSSFTYKLKFTAGGNSVTTSSISPNTTSAYTYTGYTFAIGTWAQYITTSTTATCTVVLYTYSGGSQIGSTSSKTFTLTVPSSCKPSLSIATSEGNSAITLGVYVQGKSKVTVKSTATTSYGASIKSYAVTIGSSSYSGSSVTSSTLTTAGSVSISVTITDARGRTASASTSITVQEYAAPAISTFAVDRCLDDGTYDNQGESVRVDYAYSISSLNSKNSCSMSIKYKRNSESSYGSTVTSSTNTSASGSVITANSFDTEVSYDFQITVTDLYSTTTRTISLSTALYPLSIHYSGTGVGIGKVSENANLCDIGLDTRIRNGLVVDGDTSLGDLSINGTISGQLNIVSNKQPIIKVADTNSDTDTRILVESWSGYQVWFGIGSGGVNRGVYDPIGSKWIVYADSANDAKLVTRGGSAYTPYFTAGDTITGTLYTAGYITSSGTNLSFTIPLTKPLVGVSSVSLSGTTLRIRQGGSYLYGSSADVTVTPSSWSYSTNSCGIRAVATFSNTTNVTNNDATGIEASLNITLS